VYWQKMGSGPDGRPVYADPVPVNCRWEDHQQEIVSMDGRKILSKGYILLGQFLAPGSLVMLGTMANFQSLPTYPRVPTINQGAREILICNTTPDIKGKPVVYECYI
jgi:hypothetical protein